jgi:3D (Asp-Asp-Asp) domain-containing protein
MPFGATMAAVKPKESKTVEPNRFYASFAKAKLQQPLLKLSYQETKKEVPTANETVQPISEEPVIVPLVKTEEIKQKPKMQEKTFEVTAYTANVESTGKRKGNPEYGKTASGKMIEENHTVSCPKSMPFGTKLYIPSLNNTYTCEDRGSAITDGHLDIYMKELGDALDFGRQKLQVFIVTQSEM